MQTYNSFNELANANMSAPHVSAMSVFNGFTMSDEDFKKYETAQSMPVDDTKPAEEAKSRERSKTYLVEYWLNAEGGGNVRMSVHKIKGKLADVEDQARQCCQKSDCDLSATILTLQGQYVSSVEL